MVDNIQKAVKAQEPRTYALAEGAGLLVAFLAIGRSAFELIDRNQRIESLATAPWTSAVLLAAGLSYLIATSMLFNRSAEERGRLRLRALAGTVAVALLVTAYASLAAWKYSVLFCVLFFGGLGVQFFVESRLSKRESS